MLKPKVKAGSGQQSLDPQEPDAGPAPLDDSGLATGENHKPAAAISLLEEGHLLNDNPLAPANLQHLIDEIRETYRLRVDLMRAKNRLLLQIKSVCRRLVASEIPGEFEDKKRQAKIVKEADVLYKAITGKAEHPLAFYAAGYSAPLMDAMAILEVPQKEKEKRLEKLAKQLPVWDAFGADVNGFGPLSLAQIIGETGDLSKYSNPAKVWKRMGLAVINGERQRKVANNAELAIEHGYCPTRRSLMYVISDTMIKKQSPYREVYLARKEYEAEKNPDECKAFCHNRAMRYRVKRLLKDLWAAWRKEKPANLLRSEGELNAKR